MAPEWESFKVLPAGERPPAVRGLESRAGVGDRLRSAAFAEIQAREAFAWAAERFEDSPEGLRSAWRALAEAEDRHLGWLLRRMDELGVDPRERPVSAALWSALTSRGGARDFALFMAGAEERGRAAGERFHRALAVLDPATAALFGRIAEEEAGHIALARRYFPA